MITALLIIIAIAFGLWLNYKINSKDKSNDKHIYRVNFTVSHRKLPARLIRQVNYVHNKDVIPHGERKAATVIKNYVI